MDPKTIVGQVHLTHPKDTNFTSLYEESFSKHGQNIQLFGVLEIAGSAGPLARGRKLEYEQFAQTLIAAFKKTYIATAKLDQNTFEQALASINTALGKYAARGKVSWIGKTNVVVAAIAQNQLSFSIAGKAHIYLIRRKELSVLSEGLEEETPVPVKMFSNYSSGRVTNSDRLVLTTAELLNYISQDRIREFLREETIEESCQEIMDALGDIKNVGFATFVCELSSTAEPRSVAAAIFPAAFAGAQSLSERQRSVQILGSAGRSVWKTLSFIGEFIFHLLGALIAFVYNFFRRRPRKYLFTAIGIAVLLLMVSVGSAVWKNFSQSREVETTSAVTAIEEKLNLAEAALIYEDQNQVVELMTEAGSMLASLKGGTNEERQSLANRLQELKNKVNKEVHADSPTVLTSFPNIPTELYRSPNGILAFNHNSQSLSFYDFRSGQTTTVLKNQNTSNLVFGEFVGDPNGNVFFTKNGDFQKLAPETDTLTNFDGAVPSASPDLRVIAMSALGAGANARIYLMNQRENQVLRIRAADNGFGPAEAWLKTTADFSSTVDMAVDGNIYVLFPDHADRFFNGTRENFSLSLVSPKLEKAKKIYASAETEKIYILEPDRGRILIFDKNGKLMNQLISDKFRELADISVDKATGIIYAAAGAELLQVKL